MGKIDLKIIRERLTKYQLHKKGIDRQFFLTINSALQLTQFVEKPTIVFLDEDSTEIVEVVNQLSYHNFLVNLVSALEVYLKQIIISNRNWNEVGYSKLLSEPIALQDAFKIFTTEGISREHLIAHSNSFMNLSSIDRIFTQLCGKSFLKELGKFQFSVGDKIFFTLDKDLSNWKNIIGNVFDVRHGFIHGLEFETLGTVKIELAYKTFYFLQLSMSEFFNSYK